MTNEKADVVIVGAGASGSVYASVLAKAGKKVVLLESGPDWELSDLISSEIWGRRIKPAGAPILLEGKNPMTYAAQGGWGVGGAALHYFANFPRLLPTDFKVKSEHNRAHDWPIAYEDVAPFYDKVARDTGVSGDAKAEEKWRPAGEAGRKPDQLQELGDPTVLAALPPRQAEDDVVRHAEMRKERAFLGDVADLSPLGRGVLPGAAHDPSRDPDVIAQHAGPLGDRKPGLRVDPPGQELGDPTVGIRVAGRTDVGPHTAGRAVAADHVEELMCREMGQLVETDQGDLGTLPVVDRGVELQMRKLDLAAAPPVPFMRSQARGATEPRIEVQALIP